MKFKAYKGGYCDYCGGRIIKNNHYYKGGYIKEIKGRLYYCENCFEKQELNNCKKCGNVYFKNNKNCDCV